ncbi:hypothetical protein PF005_g16531 [Phytophthora fragariae]|uniref:Secreted protein n=1 Tax=Phytophthora fragariae TaxID=53985 RepID=A0A6A3RNC0_9STRA|nr:hypothetical protein PF003_g7361 [Phytophthora fragariae]KAE8933745.1 hypothetical protein PF009_g16257 [Phytophthora fragariae]KAE9001142.1 hypothetical protein PF011_g13880 [Phytophthora fragariae]KAE9099877.1 hypothetical protein PF007_g15718 [Phytophthora fragariae]KAE9139150.1 hypothetical protein PF006_g13808 [Phytophthora fragariae]
MCTSFLFFTFYSDTVSLCMPGPAVMSVFLELTLSNRYQKGSPTHGTEHTGGQSVHSMAAVGRFRSSVTALECSNLQSAR